MAKKKGNDSPTPGGARGRKPRKKADDKAPPPPVEKKPRTRKKKDAAPAAEEPVKHEGALDFGKLSGHRKGQRKVPVEISLREASDAADRAMEISGLLRSAQANLSIVKQRQKRVVEEAAAQIETIQKRFDEEAEKWASRKAPKTRTGIWGFDLTAKSDEFPHGQKWFACADTGRIYGPDVVTKDDLEALKQQSIVHPAELKKAATLALDEEETPMPDVIITPDMLGLTTAERPQIGNCAKCDIAIYPQDGHYTYKNLLFCAPDSLCGKCNRMVLLDRDEFHRVVNGKDIRVCSDCAEGIDATGAGTHTPQSNRQKLRDAAAPAPAGDATNVPPAETPAPAGDEFEDAPPPPQTALVPHEFKPGDQHPEFCGEDFCGRQQTDPIHDVEDEEEMP